MIQKVTCDCCGGFGVEDCQICGGTGLDPYDELMCTACNGTGEEVCLRCQGTCFVEVYFIDPDGEEEDDEE